MGKKYYDLLGLYGDNGIENGNYYLGFTLNPKPYG